MLCFIGLHQPSISAMAGSRDNLTTICERCARPLVRHGQGRWVAAPPLDRTADAPRHAARR